MKLEPWHLWLILILAADAGLFLVVWLLDRYED